jgi:hypothetical protein
VAKKVWLKIARNLGSTLDLKLDLKLNLHDFKPGLKFN